MQLRRRVWICVYVETCLSMHFDDRVRRCEQQCRCIATYGPLNNVCMFMRIYISRCVYKYGGCTIRVFGCIYDYMHERMNVCYRVSDEATHTMMCNRGRCHGEVSPSRVCMCVYVCVCLGIYVCVCVGCSRCGPQYM